MDSALANQLATSSNIPLTDCFGKYLGVPSIHGRVVSSLYQDVIDRVNARLEGWKAKYLSLASRKIHVQSVLALSLFILCKPIDQWELGHQQHTTEEVAWLYQA